MLSLKVSDEGTLPSPEAVSPKHVTFVSTHRSEILRGIIQTARDIQIVRLTRNSARFSAHHVPAEVHTEHGSRNRTARRASAANPPFGLRLYQPMNPARLRLRRAATPRRTTRAL
jgi:hypothetical protein